MNEKASNALNARWILMAVIALLAIAAIFLLLRTPRVPALVNNQTSITHSLVIEKVQSVAKLVSSETTMRDVVVFEVADDGIGIAKTDQDNLFKPFSQANAQIAQIYGGAGLGLSIARDLARAMGGDITLASDGETFTVSERLRSHSAFANATQSSDLNAILGRFALAAQHRLRHLEGHPERTNAKIRG